MEQRMMEDLLRLYADLVPIKHLIPHVIAGNHNFTFQESSVKTSQRYIGKSVSQVLAEMIGVPCLGICGVHAGTDAKRAFDSVISVQDLHAPWFRGSVVESRLDPPVDCLEREVPDVQSLHYGSQPREDWHYYRRHRLSQEHEVRRGRCAMSSKASCAPLRSSKGTSRGEYVDDDTGSYVEQKCLVPAGLGIVTANLRWKQKRDSDGHLRYARDFNFTRRVTPTVPRGILSQLCTTQSYYNKMVLTRARAGLPGGPSRPHVHRMRCETIRRWCRLTGHHAWYS